MPSYYQFNDVAWPGGSETLYVSGPQLLSLPLNAGRITVYGQVNTVGATQAQSYEWRVVYGTSPFSVSAQSSTSAACTTGGTISVSSVVPGGMTYWGISCRASVIDIPSLSVYAGLSGTVPGNFSGFVVDVSAPDELWNSWPIYNDTIGYRWPPFLSDLLSYYHYPLGDSVYVGIDDGLGLGVQQLARFAELAAGRRHFIPLAVFQGTAGLLSQDFQVLLYNTFWPAVDFSGLTIDLVPGVVIPTDTCTASVEVDTSSRAINGHIGPHGVLIGHQGPPVAVRHGKSYAMVIG